MSTSYQSYGNYPVVYNPVAYNINEPVIKSFIISNAISSDTFDSQEQMFSIEKDVYGLPFCLNNNNIKSILNNKKVLVLIPGFTSTLTKVKEAVLNTAKKVRNCYDIVIGYVYPSGQMLDYIGAKVAKKAAYRLNPIFNSISYYSKVSGCCGSQYGCLCNF